MCRAGGKYHGTWQSRGLVQANAGEGNDNPFPSLPPHTPLAPSCVGRNYGQYYRVQHQQLRGRFQALGRRGASVATRRDQPSYICGRRCLLSFVPVAWRGSGRACYRSVHTAEHGMAWHGMAWYGTACHAKPQCLRFICWSCFGGMGAFAYVVL